MKLHVLKIGFCNNCDKQKTEISFFQMIYLTKNEFFLSVTTCVCHSSGFVIISCILTFLSAIQNLHFLFDSSKLVVEFLRAPFTAPSGSQYSYSKVSDAIC